MRAISEGLRLETKEIRVTIISPGVVESELASTITDPATQAAIADYRKVALTSDAIARAMAYAIEQPADVDVNEIHRPPDGFGRVSSCSKRSSQRFAQRGDLRLTSQSLRRDGQ